MKRLFAAAFAAALILAAAPASAQVYTDGGRVQASGLCTQKVAGYPVGCAPTNGDLPFELAVTTTLTQIVAAPTSGSIRITFVQYEALESATGGALELESGTGVNCATGTAVVTALAWLTASTAVSGSYGSGHGAVFILPAKTALCGVITAGTVTSAIVSGVYATY